MKQSISLRVRMHSHYVGSVKGKKLHRLHESTDNHDDATPSVQKHHKRELRRYLNRLKRKQVLSSLPSARSVPFSFQDSLPSTLGKEAQGKFRYLLVDSIVRHQKKFKLPPNEIKDGVWTVIMPKIWKKMKKSFRKDESGIWEPHLRE